MMAAARHSGDDVCRDIVIARGDALPILETAEDVFEQVPLAVGVLSDG